MNSKKSLITLVLDLILGTKYYLNVVLMTGDPKPMASAYIFPTLDDAHRHRDRLAQNLTFKYIETVTFRSRKNYL